MQYGQRERRNRNGLRFGKLKAAGRYGPSSSGTRQNSFANISPQKIGKTGALIKINFVNNEYVVTLNLNSAKRPINLIIDSGSQITLINKSVLKAGTKFFKNKKIVIEGLTGSTQSLGEATGIFSIGEIEFEKSFQIHDEDTKINSDGILGNDFFEKFKVGFCTEHKLLLIKLPVKQDQHNVNQAIKNGDEESNRSSGRVATT